MITCFINIICRSIGFLLCFCLLTFPVIARDVTGSRVVTDMAGRTLTLTRPVSRMVTTFKPATLCVFCLGLQHKLVGIDTDSRRDPLHRAVFPAVEQITAVGKKSSGLNLETIISVAPDLVVLYARKTAGNLPTAWKPWVSRPSLFSPKHSTASKQPLHSLRRRSGQTGTSSRQLP